MEGNAPSFPLPLECGRPVTLHTVALPNLPILRLTLSLCPLDFTLAPYALPPMGRP